MTAPVRTCSCGEPITRSEWDAMPLVFDGKDPESVYHGLELRSHPACGSTLARELTEAER